MSVLRHSIINHQKKERKKENTVLGSFLVIAAYGTMSSKVSRDTLYEVVQEPARAQKVLGEDRKSVV